MLKKIKIILVVLGLTLFLVMVIPNTELFKGAFDPFGKKKIPSPRLPSPPRQEAAQLPNFKDLLKKKDESKKMIPSNKKLLHSFFDKEVEKKLQEFEQKFSGASMVNKDNLLHLFNHEQLNDKLAYTKKMALLPSLLISWSKQISQIELFSLSDPLRETLNNMKSSIPKIQALYDKEQYQEVAKRISEIRTTALPVLQNVIRSQTSPQSGAVQQELLNVVMKLKWFLLFELPYPLAEDRNRVPAPPRAQSGTPLKVLVCIMRWNSNDPEISINTLRPVMQRVNDYYREVSYNKVSIQTQYAGNTVWTGPYPTDGGSETAAAIETCDPSVNFQDVDALVIYPSTQTTGGGLSFGKWQFISQDGEATTSIASIATFTSAIIEHELGHGAFDSFLGHANGLECGDASFSDEGCYPIEYLNPFDVMGGAYFEGHINGWRKKMLNWVTSTTITQDGTYPLDVLETKSSGSQVLRIPYRENPLCIEYRKPIGLDDFANKSFPDASHSQDILNRMTLPAEGCLFATICPMAPQISGQSLLLDASPHVEYTFDSAISDFTVSCINKNTSFQLSALNTSFSFSPNTRGGADVNINLDEQRVSQAPDLTIQFSMIDLCHFTRSSELMVMNNSEMGVTSPFTVRIIGIREDGSATVIFEEQITELLPGTPWTRYEQLDLSSYASFRAIVDPENRIIETDESNNSTESERNCFV
ncbi:MAG: hypothetical protein AAB588_00175 [Patescibacteria group bacterium]